MTRGRAGRLFVVGTLGWTFGVAALATWFGEPLAPITLATLIVWAAIGVLEAVAG